MLQLQINGNNSYQKPQVGIDDSSIWMPALSSNIDFVNAHIHDGVKGQFNPVISQSILSANWVAAPIAGGIFRQLVTLPTGMSFANFQLEFRLSNNNPIVLSVEPQSANTYYVYINDATQTITAVYSS